MSIIVRYYAIRYVKAQGSIYISNEITSEITAVSGASDK